MQARINFSQFKRIIVKIGTSVLTDAEGNFSLAGLKPIVAQIAHLIKSGKEILIVSSGAIGCGMKTLNLKRKPKELRTLQACAAVGQGKLMKAYEDLFSESKLHTGQVLLTRNAFEDRTRCLNIRNTLGELLQLKTIPIINENDTVSTDEIRFGDNDTLSVFVGEIIEADLLIILSDVDGLYVGERREVVSEVDGAEAVDELYKHIFSQKKTVVTAGGMSSKLEVAKRAMKNGISMVVMNGKEKDGLLRLVNGEGLGTLFIANYSKRGFKKNWLSNLTKAHGTIVVDDGAAQVLISEGKSLLPSGVRAVDGEFKAGDSVRVLTTNNHIFARGIVNYSNLELDQIKGKKTSEILSILGYHHGDEVIHRDNMVVME